MSARRSAGLALGVGAAIFVIGMAASCALPVLVGLLGADVETVSFTFGTLGSLTFWLAVMFAGVAFVASRISENSGVVHVEPVVVQDAQSHPLVDRIVALDADAGRVARQADARLAFLRGELTALAEVPGVEDARGRLETELALLEADLASLYSALLDGNLEEGRLVRERLRAETEVTTTRPRQTT